MASQFARRFPQPRRPQCWVICCESHHDRKQRSPSPIRPGGGWRAAARERSGPLRRSVACSISLPAVARSLARSPPRPPAPFFSPQPCPIHPGIESSGRARKKSANLHGNDGGGGHRNGGGCGVRRRSAVVSRASPSRRRHSPPQQPASQRRAPNRAGPVGFRVPASRPARGHPPQFRIGLIFEDSRPGPQH